MGGTKQKNKNFYGVHKGRIPGVYTDWASCQAQVNGYSNSRFRVFDTFEEAAFFAETGKRPDESGSRMPFDKWKQKQPHSQSESEPRRGGGGISAVNRVGINIKTEEERVRVKQKALLDGSQSYFSQVPNFKPNEGADFENEFSRFASSQNIQPDSRAWRQHRTNAISRESFEKAFFLISLGYMCESLRIIGRGRENNAQKRHGNCENKISYIFIKIFLTDEIMFHYSRKVKSEASDDGPSDDDNIKKEDEGQKLSWKEKLLVYQNMCREARLTPQPTIKGCVIVLKSVLVNIVDYIDAKRNNKRITVWAPHQFEEFKRYTLGDKGRRVNFRYARGTVLEPLLQTLRDPDAERMYEERKDRARRAARENDDNTWMMRDRNGHRHLSNSSGLGSGRGARLEQQ